MKVRLVTLIDAAVGGPRDRPLEQRRTSGGTGKKSNGPNLVALSTSADPRIGECSVFPHYSFRECNCPLRRTFDALAFTVNRTCQWFLRNSGRDESPITPLVAHSRFCEGIARVGKQHYMPFLRWSSAAPAVDLDRPLGAPRPSATGPCYWSRGSPRSVASRPPAPPKLPGSWGWRSL